MSRDEIVEHAGYLADEVKIKAYRAALAELVRPGSRVLDLGSGTGILGLLAAEAGARVVYSLDSGAILALAQDVARRNGYGDRVVAVRGFSTRVDLPEPVDLVVCDQIGGLAYDAGVLEYFRDARRRLLAPGGVCVPGRFELFLAPVEAERWRRDVGIWDARPAGFDFGPVAEHAANTEFRVELGPGAFLGEPVPLAEVPADRDDPICTRVEAVVEQAGELHGMAGMFRARLSPSVSLTNCPLWPASFRRWQTFYPLRSPVRVEPGDVVVTEIDVRPRSYLASWRITVRPVDGRPPVVSRRASTALGRFLTAEDLAVESGRAVPRAGNGLDAERYALELVDGSRTLGEIVDAVWARHPHACGTRDETARRVNRLLARHLRDRPACAS